MTDVDLSEFYRNIDSRCVIGKFYDKLSEEDGAKLSAALKSSDISLMAIVKWLSTRDLRTTDTTVSTHRKGMCRCD